VTATRLVLVLLTLPCTAAAQDRCPWLNAATAGGVLGGAPQFTVTPTSCEFIRRLNGQESILRIEVTSVTAPHEQCKSGAEPLKAIGNQAAACTYEGKPGWTAEQVTGTVRDQAFLVRLATSDRTAASKTLREKVRNIAEQVAGILF